MNPKIQNNTVVLFNEMIPFRKVLYEHISTKITILEETGGKSALKSVLILNLAPRNTQAVQATHTILFCSRSITVKKIGGNL